MHLCCCSRTETGFSTNILKVREKKVHVTRETPLSGKQAISACLERRRGITAQLTPLWARCYTTI